MLNISIFLLQFFVFNYIQCFYYTTLEDTSNLYSDKYKILDDFKIELNDPLNFGGSNANTSFPIFIHVQFTHNERLVSLKFIKSLIVTDKQGAHSKSNSIYVIESGKIILKLNDSREYEHYSEVKGRGHATLIKNTKNEVNLYRMIASVFLSGNLEDAAANYEIVPINVITVAENETREFNSEQNLHAILEPKIKKLDKVNSEIVEKVSVISADSISSKTKQHKKRSVNGSPLTLYVEILVVADSSIYEDHKLFADSTDPAIVRSQMRIYYSHVINGVNERFKNSFAHDPDLKIMVVCKNFLFIQNKSDYSLRTGNSSSCMHDKSALDRFSQFMSLKSFPFQFDLAIGFFKYRKIFL
jgi:hypothetical protein